MRIRALSSSVTAVLVVSLALFACVGDDPVASSAADPTDTTGPEGGATCAKMCGGACAPASDPSTGCGAASCAPCPTGPHQSAACRGDACATGACEKGFLDCDPAQAGCETDGATDAKNCGACHAVCGTANATSATCAAGECKFVCEGNRAHCSKDPSTGCDTDLALDTLNCGACGHSCGGGACVAGTCQPLLIAGDPLTDTGLDAQYGITVLGGFVYGVNWYGGAGGTGGVVFKVPVDGSFSGKVPPWVYGGAISASATGIFSNGKDFAFGVYRQDAGGPAPGIWAFDTKTSTATNIVVGAGSLNTCPQNPGSSIVSVAFDATYVYWTNQQAPGAPAAVNPCPGVYRAKASDGTERQSFLAPHQIDNLLADGGSVYLMDRTDGYLHAALGATLGTTSSLAQFTAGNAFKLAVDGTYAYVADNTSKKVFRVKKVGGGTPIDITPAKGTLAEPCSNGFIVDDKRVYCAGPSTPTKIFAFDKDGSSATTSVLATVGNGDFTYGPLTQDATAIYWATAGAAGGAHSAVYKLAK